MEIHIFSPHILHIHASSLFTSSVFFTVVATFFITRLPISSCSSSHSIGAQLHPTRTPNPSPHSSP
ncbi:hypothetical protein ACS0TY_017475 [Phlomoides rotata]